MDCWTDDLNSTNPSKGVLDQNQTLGSDYGGPNINYPHHSGIDEDCNAGDAVFATHAGKVTVAEARDTSGNTVKVQNDNGTFSAFAHLLSFSVVQGARVGVGTQIGTCDATGTGGEVGHHLHYEVQCPSQSNCFLDPTSVHPCQSPQ